MLFRKIGKQLEEYLTNPTNKILMVDGARQIGKSFIINYYGKKLFKNFISIDFVKDFEGKKLFENVRTVDDFYLQLGIIAGNKMGTKENTLVFLDEIQQYPQFLTMLKFLKQDDKFTYICSGSLLGITLSKTTSIPIGSIEVLHMYPLDFEEFLYACDYSKESIETLRQKFLNLETLEESTHNALLSNFKKYLLVGGMPDAVNEYISTKNIVEIRNIQTDIQTFYGDDASKYDFENKLKIKRIYDFIPTLSGNRKKRIVFQDIENNKNKRYLDYLDEFDYLINSGIALDVKAISTPIFPLIQNTTKNLLKLYLNDVGILTNVLYKTNITSVLNDEKSINLGSVYETVVASELKAHGFDLYYYDNKQVGEVDFLINDYDTSSVLPLEIKSGKDYTTHRALDKFLSNPDYNVKKAYVLSNERTMRKTNSIIYIPIYFIMFFNAMGNNQTIKLL